MKAFLKELLAANPDAGVVEGPDGRIMDANSAFLALVGWDKPFHDQLLDDLLAPWQSRLALPQPLARYFEACRAGQIPASPLEMSLGSTSLEIRCIATQPVEGISYRIWFFREKRPSALAWLNREVRNPLTAVLGFVDLLNEEFADPAIPEKTRSMLRSLVFSTRHLHSILAEPTSPDGSAAVPEWVLLASLLQELELLYRYRFRRRGLELLVEVPDCPTLQLWVDPGRLTRILDSLLGNALTFTQRGWVALRVSEVGGGWSFVVEDSGVGIALERQKELPKGRLGLGMTICDVLVRSLGGTLTLESELGHGSRFNATFPGLKSRSEEGVCLDDTSAGGTGLKILIADDEKSIHLLIQGFLKGTGVTFLEATDGQQAVELWTTHRPDLVLMDLRMPRLSGRDAARRILTIDPHTSTQFLALSAMSPLAQDMTGGRPLWAGYLPKPFTKQGLHRFLSRFITLPR